MRGVRRINIPLGAITLVLLATVSALVAPSSALAGYAAPATVVGSGGDPFGYPADIGFSSTGQATVALVGSGSKLLVLTRPAGGGSFTGGPIVTATKASMAVSSNGAAVIAYRASATSVGVAYRPPGGSFNATAQTYSGAAVGNVAAGIDDNGNAVVAWKDGVIRYALSSGATFGPAQNAPLGATPSFDGKGSDAQRDHGPRAFRDDAGNVVLVFRNGSDATVAHRSPSGVWDSAALPGGASSDITSDSDARTHHLIVGYTTSGAFHAFVGTTASSTGSVEVQGTEGGANVSSVAVRHGGTEDLALWTDNTGAVQAAGCMEGYQATKILSPPIGGGLAAAVTSGDEELAVVDAPPGLQRGVRTPGGTWSFTPFTVSNYGTFSAFGTGYAGDALMSYIDFPSDTAVTGFPYSGAANGTPPVGSTCAPSSTGPRPTGTAVSCNYTVATGIDTCGAQVGDGGPQPPSVTPTGTVTFTSNPPSIFVAGTACQLQPTPLSPQVASCTVDILLSGGAQFPVVTARYSGDAQHAVSSGSTSFLVAGGITGLDDNGPTTTDPQTCVAPSGLAHEAQQPSTGEKIANKLCDLVAAGAAGRIAAMICGAAIPGSESVALPIACVVALGVAGFSLKWFLDPADRHFRDLYVAKPRPTKLPACRGPRRGACTSVRGALTTYLKALNAVLAEQDGLATTGDRLSSARAAKDKAATLLQIAARKIYVGELAAADATLNTRGTALAAALARAHINRRLSAGGLRKALADLLAHPNAAVKKAVKSSGVTAARFASTLTHAVTVAGGAKGAQSLLSILRTPLEYKPFQQDYRSITLDNLRALVRGLARQSVIKSSTTTDLLTQLSCTPAHTKPTVKKFVTLVKRRPVRAAEGRLLAFAAAPLTKRSICR